MKKYKVYRNIRKRAMIWGLPISLFAVMMLSIITSLLVIIFSFSLMVIVAVLLWNAGLYLGLTKVLSHNGLPNLASQFPKSISNKKQNLAAYVNY